MYNLNKITKFLLLLFQICQSVQKSRYFKNDALIQNIKSKIFIDMSLKHSTNLRKLHNDTQLHNHCTVALVAQ